VNKQEPQPLSYTLRIDHIPGITAGVAHYLEEHINKPEVLWAKYVSECASDIGKFAAIIRRSNPNLPMFHIMNCVRFLDEVSNIIECVDICLIIAQTILRDPYTLNISEVTKNYLQKFTNYYINDIWDLQKSSIEFIQNVMKYLLTGGTCKFTSFDAAFTRMMKERTDKPPPYTYPPGYVHLPPYTEQPICEPPNEPLPEYSVVLS
jgi:hypothetical protein